MENTATSSAKKLYWEDYGPDEDIPVNDMAGVQIRSTEIPHDQMIVTFRYEKEDESIDVIHLAMRVDVGEEFSKGLRKAAREYWEEKAASRANRNIH